MNQIRFVWRITVPWMGALLLTGTACDQLNSRLLTMHASPHRREEAQERWDNVRGEVKLQLARQHLVNGRLDEAEKVLAQVASIAPREPQAFALLARLRLEQGRYPEARQAVQAARALSSDDAEIDYLGGILAQRYGDTAEALASYTAAARKAPNQPEYLYAQVEMLLATDQPIEAMEALTARLADFDNQAAAHTLAARVCRLLGLRGPACEHAQAAARLSGHDETASLEAAELFLWADRPQDVVTILLPIHQSTTSTLWLPSQRADAPNPASAAMSTSRVRLMLAAAYLSMNQPRDVLAVLAGDLRHDTIDPSAACLYVRAALTLGELESAESVMSRLLEAQKDSPEVFALQAYVALQRNDPDGCLAAADRALALDERFASVWCLKAQAAELRGDDDAARACYARALSLEPAHAYAQTRLAALSTMRQCDASDDKLGLESMLDGTDVAWRVAP